jgi:pimeloyl-ACP methyl ester carboxylesterase
MKILHLLIPVVLLATITYGLSCAYLYVNQERLIFFAPRANPQLYQHWQQHEYLIEVNGHRLHGWQIEQAGKPAATILYFGGNAEDVVYNLDDAPNYAASRLFFTNYPGYGKSSGEPSQQNLFDDALALYDSLLEQHRLQPENIYIMGRSLGSSVASYLASQREVAGLILVTPFDSMENLAANYYSWFPVRWLLKHKFNTIDFIHEVSAPILVLAAADDEVIPQAHLEKLYQAAGGNARMISIDNADHQNINLRPGYFSAINRFIQPRASAD